MDSPATPEDVAARWRTLSDAEYVKAVTLLADAWTLIKLRNPTVETRVVATTLDQGLVVMVQCAMVIRVLRNPDGKRQEASEDYSYTRDDTSSSGSLLITDVELAMLDDVVGVTSGAFTIRPYTDPETVYSYANPLHGYVSPSWDYPP